MTSIQGGASLFSQLSALTSYGGQKSSVGQDSAASAGLSQTPAVSVSLSPAAQAFSQTEQTEESLAALSETAGAAPPPPPPPTSGVEDTGGVEGVDASQGIGATEGASTEQLLSLQESLNGASGAKEGASGALPSMYAQSVQNAAAPTQALGSNLSMMM